MISPVLFSFKMDDLFNLLKSSGSGCVLGNHYSCCMGHADNLLFICPSRAGLQNMLEIAQKYVENHKISFSTHPDQAKSKTNGIVFWRSPLTFNLLHSSWMIHLYHWYSMQTLPFLAPSCTTWALLQPPSWWTAGLCPSDTCGTCPSKPTGT